MTSLEKKIVEQSNIIAPHLYGRCRHISFLCIRNRIISFGVNSYVITHPLAKKFGALGANVHSELDAIVAWPHKRNDISRATMYNVRIGGNDELRLSAPCKSCMKLVMAYNIRRLYYSTSYNSFERLF